MEKNTTTGLLIISFVAILLSVIAVTIIADGINGITQLTTATETISITPAIIDQLNINNSVHLSLSAATEQSGFRTEYSECGVSALTSLANYSGIALTTSAKYNFTAAVGSTPAYIVIQNDTASFINPTSNITTAVYNYCADDYIGGWSKTVLKLTPGFFVLAILAAALLVAFLILRREGIEL